MCERGTEITRSSNDACSLSPSRPLPPPLPSRTSPRLRGRSVLLERPPPPPARLLGASPMAPGDRFRAPPPPPPPPALPSRSSCWPISAPAQDVETNVSDEETKMRQGERWAVGCRRVRARDTHVEAGAGQEAPSKHGIGCARHTRPGQPPPARRVCSAARSSRAPGEAEAGHAGIAWAAARPKQRAGGIRRPATGGVAGFLANKKAASRAP